MFVGLTLQFDSRIIDAFFYLLRVFKRYYDTSSYCYYFPLPYNIGFDALHNTLHYFTLLLGINSGTMCAGV